MQTPTEDDIERRLLALEDVDDDSVRAVVTGALERGSTYGSRRGARVGLALAAAGVLVASAVLVDRHRANRSTVEFFRVTSVHSLIVIEPDDRTCWIVGSVDDAARATPRGGYVLIEGEDR